jgi:hypothetical protein
VDEREERREAKRDHRLKEGGVQLGGAGGGEWGLHGE